MTGEAGDLLTSYGGGPLRRYDHRALGTWNVLLLADRDPERPAETDRAAQAAWVLLDRLEDELSRFRPESDVSLINALGAAGPVPVGRALLAVLKLARWAWEATGGAFDPTVGPLMDAWGFPQGPARVPPREEIEALLARRGMDHVVIDEAARTVRFDRPGVALDLGAIGKGYAVDRVRDLLSARGVPGGAVLSGRSTIALWGSTPGEEGFQVKLVHPREPEETLSTLLVGEGSISTSASSAGSFVHQGVEYGHILDPRTGCPVQSPVRSVTVWTREAARGDALSTALYVLGRAGAERLLATEERASALIVEEDSSVWGGLGVDVLHHGPPGFRVASGA